MNLPTLHFEGNRGRIKELWRDALQPVLLHESDISRHQIYMKICKYCKIDKELTDFHANPTTKDKLATGCKDCMRLICTTARKDNAEHYRLVAQKRRRRKREQFVEWKKQQVCSRCGENDFCTLDLHHVDPTQKDYTLSKLAESGSWTKLVAEMQKCIVVCSNCHRKIHNALMAERSNAVSCNLT